MTPKEIYTSPLAEVYDTALGEGILDIYSTEGIENPTKDPDDIDW